MVSIRKALFTHEDSFNLHKTLGLTCLLHYIYRFSKMGSKDMDFSPSVWTLCCIGLHALLSVSSLIFKIPTKRIAEGSRIWPEYRIHSIVFACRSLLCMLVTWCELRAGVLQPRYELNAAVVLLTLAAADAGTWWVGPQGRSSTIQELDAPGPLRYFFSVMQFHATAGCLVGVRRFSTQFVYVSDSHRVRASCRHCCPSLHATARCASPLPCPPGVHHPVHRLPHDAAPQEPPAARAADGGARLPLLAR
jgi:hypothetical protein